MKKLLFALCALAAIALLTPSAGFAQWQTRIGIYASATADSTRIDPAEGAFFYVYFVLTSPLDADGAPATAIKGYEFTVTVTGPVEGLVKFTDLTFPNTIDLGTSTDYANSSYFAAAASPQPVTNGMIVLRTWKMKSFDSSAPYYFFVAPYSVPTFAGDLAILDGAGRKVRARGSADLYTTAVFAIGDDTVANESATFGSVKALFR